MRGNYSCPLDGLTLTNDSDQDIWVASNGANVTSILTSFRLASNMTTDERLRLRLVRRSTAGSGGSAATEVKTSVGDASPTLAITTLVTTPGTIGDILEGFIWSQLADNVWLLIPQEQIEIPPSGILALNLQTAVAASRTISGAIKWQELG